MHTRLSSLLRRYGREVNREADVTLLGAEQELALVRLLYRYPAVVRQAAAEYEPAAIGRYLIDLASAVSRYWHDVRILTDDAAQTAARVLLCWCGRHVLNSGLTLLGVPPRGDVTYCGLRNTKRRRGPRSHWLSAAGRPAPRVAPRGWGAPCPPL